jgi:DNA polymerase III epsilon subunit family exonuclease
MKISECEFVVIDTETTGVDPENCKIIEIAARCFTILSNHENEKTFSSLINPGENIPPVSSSIHHITDEDVSNSPSITEIEGDLLSFIDNKILIAHNSDYDKTVLSQNFQINNCWIDTYRLAMKMWHIGEKNNNGFELKSFSQQELRYWLGLPKTTGEAHRASADIQVTANLFRMIVNKYLSCGMSDNLDEFLNWVNSPIMHKTIPFGWGIAGKQPEELTDWELRKVFDKKNNLYNAYEKFNVLDYVRPTYITRIGEIVDTSLGGKIKERMLEEKQATSSFKPKGLT